MDQIAASVVHQKGVNRRRSTAGCRPVQKRGAVVGEAEGCEVVGRGEDAVGRVVGVEGIAAEDEEAWANTGQASNFITGEPISRVPSGQPEASSNVKSSQSVIGRAEEKLIA